MSGAQIIMAPPASFVSILYWRCSVMPSSARMALILAFQFSIGDAEAPAATAAATTAVTTRFNSLLEMPSLRWRTSHRRRYRWHVSILYWRCGAGAGHRTRRRPPQVSILYWRCMLKELTQLYSFKRYEFQFSIGDAKTLRFSWAPQTRLVSILYWRCPSDTSFFLLSSFIQFQFSIGDAEVHDRFIQLRDEALFQFSIGDAPPPATSGAR